MTEIAFLVRIHSENEIWEELSKIWEKNGNYNVRVHTLKTIYKGVQQISQNIVYTYKGKTSLCIWKTLGNAHFEDHKL